MQDADPKTREIKNDSPSLSMVPLIDVADCYPAATVWRSMTVAFWISFCVVAYAYFGYALLLTVIVKLRRQPVLTAPITPNVSIIMAVRNEQHNLVAKLKNLSQLDYPQDKLQIVVVSDGSTDGTADILRAHPQVVSILLDVSGGKASALNMGVPHATGEVLVFLDVRQSVDINAVSELVSCFNDPAIGAVSGELLLESAPGVLSADALGIYWKIEKLVRKLESASGSVVGVTGAIYAMRRELFVTIPPATILDDVFVPMQVVHQGKRVIFQPLAIARDRIFSEKGKEFSRKVRTLTGNYQLVQLAPWMLSPSNPILFRFISHKLLRLVVPVFLLVMLFTSAVSSGPFYGTIYVLQFLFYLLAAIGFLLPSLRRIKPVAIATTFVMLNAAATVAFYNFIRGRYKVWA